MSLMAIAGLVLVAGMGAYVQTLTGFAFGLIMMGAIALAGLMPLPDAAVVVSALALVNAAQMALKGWRLVLRRELALMLATNLPTIVVGYWLLGYMAEAQSDVLKVVLGAVIIASSVQLARKPLPLAHRSSDASFLGFGAVSGIMGGLFSTSGPPLVYHLYRQPLPVERIRETLVTTFGIAAILRLSLVVGHGDLPPLSSAPALLAIPAVIGGTHLARRYPPPLTPAAFRRLVFGLLMASGLALALPAIQHMLAAV